MLLKCTILERSGNVLTAFDAYLTFLKNSRNLTVQMSFKIHHSEHSYVIFGRSVTCQSLQCLKISTVSYVTDAIVIPG